jgi:hypothetical protein
MREYRYLCATKRLCQFGRGAGWREGREVDGRGNAGEKLRHDVRGGGGEENAIAVVASGDEMVRFCGQSAEERKAVGSCGAETCPGFELRGVGQRGKQRDGE